MTISTERLDASDDHVAQYPIVPSAPCCGPPVTNREPMPPGWMLLDGKPFMGPLPGLTDAERSGVLLIEGLDGLGKSSATGPRRSVATGPTYAANQQHTAIPYKAPRQRVHAGARKSSPLMGIVVTQSQALHPTLRGLAGTRPWTLAPTPRLGGCGCDGPTAGLGDFTTAVVDAATAAAEAWLAPLSSDPTWRLTVTFPPTPTDVIAAVYRLAETERELEMLRRKLRRMRTEGLLRPADVTAYNTAAAAYFVAAKAVYTPVVSMIRTASPAAAAAIPPIKRPPSIDAPDQPLPWVPSMADVSRLRAGVVSGGDASFSDAVAYVRSRLPGSGGTSGLGVFVLDDITIGGIILVVIGLLAIAAIAIAIAVPAYALTQVLVAWLATRAAADVATRRKEVYDACIARGGSGTACTTEAQGIVPMPVIPPPPGFGLELGVGGLVLGVAAVGAAWYFLGGGKEKARAAFASYTPVYGPPRVRKAKKLKWR